MLRVLAGIIRTFAFVVPRAARSRWREEWLAELHQIADRRGTAATLRAACGLPLDAIAMRRFVATRFPFSSMDCKLAVRMLVRFPGLTLVGVAGMAVAIAIVAGAFSILYTLVDPALPLPDGDRIVAIQNWDQSTNRAERRTLHDALMWRAEATSLRDVGVFRNVALNLIAEDTATETVTIAEISASAFRVVGVAPLMGRALRDEDERSSAPPVVVLGFKAWRDRFHSDPSIVGRTIRFGDAHHDIVGVMPDGFEFPVNHQFWIPFRLDASRFERRRGPSVQVFGKLAPGTTLEGTAAELATLGQRAASDFPTTNAQLRPLVTPYTFPFFDIDDASMIWMVHLMQFLISLLLVIACVNVAILVYARTARRHGEIAVRSALGASRGRIVSQLFVEALGLSIVAALVGLGVCAVALDYLNELMRGMYGSLPFWWKFELSAGVIAYVIAMTLVSAAIVGVLPALKATGRRLQSGLQGISAGGGSSMRFGRTWTVLIVAQVAIAVALLPAAVFHAWEAVRYGTADPGFAAHEFLTTSLALDTGATPTAADTRTRYAARLEEVLRRLRAEAAVSDVTFATGAPGDEGTVVIEVEGVPNPNELADYNIIVGTRVGHLARLGRVDPRFFSVFDVPLLTGRGFQPADVNAGATAILVNRAFVSQFFADGNVLGRRVRYVGQSGDSGYVELGRWFEIVGVVDDFPAISNQGLSPAKLYHASTAAQLYPAAITMRIRGMAPTTFTPRLREVTAAVDPNLQLWRVTSLDTALREEQSVLRLIAAVLVALTFSVLMLSAAGIYSMMSFTVSQRRKEIGIRTALGADPSQILRSIFSRVLWQLGLGAAIGVGAAAFLEVATGGGLMQGQSATVLPIVAVTMMLVGLAAAIGPARRGLRVQPTEALRQE